MGRVLVLLAIVAIVAIILLVAWISPMVSAWNARRKAEKNERASWIIAEEDMDNGDTQVVLRKPGEPVKRIGPAISCQLPAWQFEDELIERRVEAEAKAASLNRRLSA